MKARSLRRLPKENQADISVLEGSCGLPWAIKDGVGEGLRRKKSAPQPTPMPLLRQAAAADVFTPDLPNMSAAETPNPDGVDEAAQSDDEASSTSGSSADPNGDDADVPLPMDDGIP